MDDLKSGNGTYLFASGAKYEGQWLNGKKYGFGKETYARDSNGDYYIGEFKDGEKNGNGKLVWQDGEVYEGEFVDGLRSGNGTQLYASGAKYKGRWLNDQLNGFGNYTYASNNLFDYYIGEFKDGKSNGKGKEVSKSGEIYEGEFVDDLRSGNGTCLYASGGKYEGQWLNSKFNGFGKYTFARDDNKGRDYAVGHWTYDKLDGKGELKWRNGTTYDGDWQNGYRHGFGTLFDSNGSITFKGQWENDEQKNL